jgi:hypothetical protein
MDDRSYNEKDEKELRKHEEKTADEKTYDEKYRQDPVGAVAWAATLIWAGIVLLANNLGFLYVFTDLLKALNLPSPAFPEGFIPPFRSEAWTVFLLGAALIVLVGVVVRLLVPSYRRRVVGSLIWAGVLVGLALGNWELIGPIVLIAVGLSILMGGFFRRQ